MKNTTQIINIKAFLLGLIIAIAGLALVLSVAPEASAQIDSIRQGVGSTGETSSPGEAEATIYNTVETAINIFSIIIGVISVIMIIIGGLKYITSTGDSGKVDSAKNTILYAVIGLVVVALAQVIVFFVLDRVGGSSGGGDESGESSSIRLVDDVAIVDTSWR